MVQRAKWKCFCNLSKKATNSCHRASTRGCSRSVTQSWSTEAAAGTLSNTDHGPDHRIMVPRPRYRVTAASPAMSGSPTSAFHSVSTVAAADRSAPEKTILDSWDNFVSAATSFQTLFKWTRAAWPERPWTRISVATQWSRTIVLTRDLCSGVSCIGAAVSSGTDCLPFKRLRFISAGHIAQ